MIYSGIRDISAGKVRLGASAMRLHYGYPMVTHLQDPQAHRYMDWLWAGTEPQAFPVEIQGRHCGGADV
jgi:hypothetical protein